MSEKTIERIVHAIIAAALIGTQYHGIGQSGQIRQDVQEVRCGGECIQTKIDEAIRTVRCKMPIDSLEKSRGDSH